MNEYDIIVTTYAVLSSEMNRRGPGQRKSIKSRQDFLKWMAPLEKIIFHRIVLDESHTLRNTSTTQTKACFRLCSRYKWCVTGTPFGNDFLDILGQLKFLGAYPFDSRALLEQIWENEIFLKWFMKSIMIRHSKSQYLN